MYNSIRINDADELMPPPFILSAKKAAELTGLCYATVIRHCKDGTINAFKNGREWCIYGDDLAAMMGVGRAKPERKAATGCYREIVISHTVFQHIERKVNK